MGEKAHHRITHTKQATHVHEEAQLAEATPEQETPSQPKDSRYYPLLSIERNTKPNRSYAVPVLGGVLKGAMIIPVVFWLLLISIWIMLVSIYNSIRVWTKGTYSQYAFDLFVGSLTLSAKTTFFWAGITDTYPGFSLKPSPLVKVSFPANPNRLFATPIVGGFIRILLLIPYGIYQRVIGTATEFAVVGSSFPVLFAGYYPESAHELYVDSYRLEAALTCYMLGISDTYPSFKISMNHKWIKIGLIIVGILYTFGSNFGSAGNRPATRTYPAPTLTIPQGMNK